MIQDVFKLVVQNPGIDTPSVCLFCHKKEIKDPGYKGAALAMWLMKNHHELWDETCSAVDELISLGQVSFSDDGELYPVGY